jgi:hypothetical protein
MNTPLPNLLQQLSSKGIRPVATQGNTLPDPSTLDSSATRTPPSPGPMTSRAATQTTNLPGRTKTRSSTPIKLKQGFHQPLKILVGGQGETEGPHTSAIRARLRGRAKSLPRTVAHAVMLDSSRDGTKPTARTPAANTEGTRHKSVPPGTWPSYTNRCHTCSRTLRWSPPYPFTTCQQCFLPSVAPPRILPLPVFDPHGPLTFECDASALLVAHQIRCQWRPLCVTDFRWGSVRQHPLDDQLVVVCRFDQAIAVIPRSTAAFWRSCLLRQWRTSFPNLTISENDIAAYSIAVVITSNSAEWSRPKHKQFRGFDHVFLPWNSLTEPGIFRPAMLQSYRGPLRLFDRATSAFTEVTQFGSPLRYTGYQSLIPHHPQSVFLQNSIRFGFPLMTTCPSTRRGAPAVGGKSVKAKAVVAALMVEVTEGAMVRINPSLQYGLRIRFAPFIGAPKSDGTTRGISDMSWGENSVNKCTRRGVTIKARLAELHTVVARVAYMQRQRPGVPVLMAKLDVTRAFRQCALPIREFAIAAHRLDSDVMLNTRLMMGAVTSGDSMSAGISAIGDWLGEVHGLFAISYVDDKLVVVYADEADTKMAITRKAWSLCGWPESAKKRLVEGTPSTQMVFLGILFDTAAGTASLTPARRDQILQIITKWLHRKQARTPREFSKLAGRLQFVATTTPFGKVFLRSLYKHAYSTINNGASPVHDELPTEVVTDLIWWRYALQQGNTTAHFKDDVPRSELHIYTDASGLGWGAACITRQEYACGPWTPEERKLTSTAHWEGAAIVFAAFLWGAHAAGGYLVIHSDSAACVHAFTKNTCTDPRMALLLRALSIVQIHLRFRLRVYHIPGVDNTYADKLSRSYTPTPEYAHHNVIKLPPLTRRLGNIMHVKWPSHLSLGQLDTTLRSMTFKIIAENSTILSRHPPPWTPWSSPLPADLLSTVVCSVSVDGLCFENPIFTATRCHRTSQWFVRAWRSYTGGSLSDLIFSTPTCTECVRSLTTDVSRHLQPSNSSNWSWTISQSPLEPGLQCCVRTMDCSEPQSTHVTEPADPRAGHVCWEEMSHGTSMGLPSGSGTLNRTSTTPVQSFTSWPETATDTAPWRHFDLISTTKQWPATQAPLSLSNASKEEVSVTLPPMTFRELLNVTPLRQVLPRKMFHHTVCESGVPLSSQTTEWIGPTSGFGVAGPLMRRTAWR